MRKFDPSAQADLHSDDSPNDHCTAEEGTSDSSKCDDSLSKSFQGGRSGFGTARHALKHSARKVASVACAVGAFLIPHFLCHKNLADIAASSKPNSDISDSSAINDSHSTLANIDRSDGTIPSHAEIAQIQSRSSVSDEGTGRLMNDKTAEPFAQLAYANKLLSTLPVIAETVPGITPTRKSIGAEAPSLAANKSNSIRKQNPVPSASFVIGKRVPTKETLFADTKPAKQKSEELQSEQVTVDKANHRIMIGQTLLKCSLDTEIYLNQRGTVKLAYGETLIDAKNPLLLKIGSDCILVKRDTTVLVTVRYGTLKVRDLQENHLCSTELYVSKRIFTLCAGQELVAADSFDNLQAATSSDEVRRRQVQTYELMDGTNIMCAEFAPLSVMKHDELVKSISHSNDESESKVFGKIMKMAACLTIVTSPHGSFAPIEPKSQKVALSIK